MPTRKQKRRRQKGLRHEYEYVYVDDEGQEVEVDEDELEPSVKAAPVKAGVRPSAKSAKQAGKPAGKKPAMREVKPPSWDRVFRRGLIFAPVMLVVVYLLKPDSATPASIIVQVLVLLVFFLPFSYFMDTVMYRQYRKRIGDPLPPRGSKPKP